MKKVPTDFRIPVMIAQNSLYIVLPDNDNVSNTPFFISTTSTSRCDQQTVEADFEYGVIYVNDLPDVIIYERHLRLSGLDEWDLTTSVSPENLLYRIPIGCFLPGTLVSEGRQCDIVYCVTRWINEKVANVVVHYSDGLVEPCAGSHIVRTCRDSQGKTQQKTVCVIRKEVQRHAHAGPRAGNRGRSAAHRDDRER